MAVSFWAWLTHCPTAKSPRRRQTRSKNNKLGSPLLELLEARDLPSGFQPDYMLMPRNSGISPFASGGPTGTTPAQIRQAYGFNGITFNSGTVVGDGSGTTIAIVDAYNDPNVASDLDAFDKQFGIATTGPTLYQQYGPASSFFKVVSQTGGSTLPSSNTGWSEEIALDVEWAHAIAPGASILLVEANSSSYADLMTAVAYGAKQPGVVAVSMSWGGSEFSGEQSYDSYFQTPTGHQGVTFVVSSGDSGAPASYPATSPNVLAVGGTSLYLTASSSISSESAWSGSGGGISADEAQPSYQKGVVTQSTTMRTNPDVSYDANPNTGFPEYNSYSFPTSPWEKFGGTSDAAPQWAALIAIADEGRIKAGLGSLDSRSQTLPAIYSLPAADFHDITSGSSTGSPSYAAGPGYDLATGRGSPVANLIIAGLAGQSTSAPNSTATHFGVTVSAASTAGAALTVTVTALDVNGNKVTGYTGTVQFASSDSSAVLPTKGTLTSGVGIFTLTLKTAGNLTLTVADVSTSSLTGSAGVTVSAAAASSLAFGQQPTNVAAGSAITPAVTVRVLDAYGNLVSTDNSDKVVLAIGTNVGSGTLNGTANVTVSGGMATFTGLTINNVANGYTLKANSGSLIGVTSAAFNVTATSSGSGTGNGSATLIEGFETSDSWNIVGGSSISAVLATYAAHDGTYGLDQYGSNEWIYRSDAGAQVKAGDTVSVWLEFSGSADGRAYFGFGASGSGTLALVAAPNTGQLIIQNNAGYGYTDLASVSQTYQTNHWYRLEVDWSTSGKIAGKLYDSNGTTLLQSVNASTTAITSGGIAFRAIGSDKYWDTVTDLSGVNSFTHSAATGTGGTSGGTSLFAVGGSQLSQAVMDRYFAYFFGGGTEPGLTLPSWVDPWVDPWTDPFATW